MANNVHVIIGEDDYLVAETAKKIVGDGTGLELIDSITATNAEMQLADLRRADASFMTPPFLDPRKVTWWRNVHFLPGGSGGKKEAAEDVKAGLEKFAHRLAEAHLPDNQHFILSGPRLLKTSIFAKTLAGAVEMVVFASGKPENMAMASVNRVLEEAAERGLTFETGAVERFVARVGNDTRSLLSELDKMRAYLGETSHTITAQDIETVTTQGAGVETEIWGITDALGARDIEKCLLSLRPFEQESGFAVIISTVVEKFFRQMIDVAAQRAMDLNPYVRQKLTRYLRNWTPRELQLARKTFLMLRERAVSSSVGVEELIVTNLVRVCRRPGTTA